MAASCPWEKQREFLMRTVWLGQWRTVWIGKWRTVWLGQWRVKNSLTGAVKSEEQFDWGSEMNKEGLSCWLVCQLDVWDGCCIIKSTMSANANFCQLEVWDSCYKNCCEVKHYREYLIFWCFKVFKHFFYMKWCLWIIMSTLLGYIYLYDFCYTFHVVNFCFVCFFVYFCGLLFFAE